MNNEAQKPPTLDEVKALIDRLERRDRADLRPWILAHYEVDGSKHKRLNEDLSGAR